jgi:isopenicillin N synthase-like dioxygenase
MGVSLSSWQTTSLVPFKVGKAFNLRGFALTHTSVEAKDGSWIPADPVPGAFVVNIGDIMDALTSHAYKSTYHRVIHRGSKFRVSIPFFFEPPRDMTIVPIKSMVPEGQEAIKPFVYFDHLKVCPQ